MKKYRIFLVGGIIFVSEIVWQMYKRFSDSRKRTINRASLESGTNVNEPRPDITEVMFFSNDSSPCRTHSSVAREDVCFNDACPVRYLRKLECYINNAKMSVDVCMYIFTCQSLSTAIVNAHKRGVLVRIIMDRGMACNDAAQTDLFHKNGVAIRLHHLDDALMHHKFMIVDGDIVITGSMNWTMSAFFGNFDNILVTNQWSLVTPFVDEFEKLWRLFEFPVDAKFEKNMKRNGT